MKIWLSFLISRLFNSLVVRLILVVIRVIIWVKDELDVFLNFCSWYFLNCNPPTTPKSCHYYLLNGYFCCKTLQTTRMWNLSVNPLNFRSFCSSMHAVWMKVSVRQLHFIGLLHLHCCVFHSHLCSYPVLLLFLLPPYTRTFSFKRFTYEKRKSLLETKSQRFLHPLVLYTHSHTLTWLCETFTIVTWHSYVS